MQPWQILKLVHILSVIVALGANLTYACWLARAGRDPDRLVFVIESIGRLDRRIANPAYIVAFLAGAGIVLTGPFSFGTLWVGAAIVLYVLVALLGGPTPRGAATPARRPSARPAARTGGAPPP